MNAMVGYYMHQDPCPIMIVQPTVDDAEGYSKEELAPMIRDCEVLSEIFRGDGKAKTTNDTIAHKTYPGGSISLVGANSGRGFRRVSRKVVGCDEVDAYPHSAGADGDPVKLAIRRTEHYWDRLIYLASTPLTEGQSRISEEFDRGDKRYFYVPCPHCGHMDRLVFEESEHGGHWMRWPEGKPEEAHFVCCDCGCEISHDQKRDMIEGGEWRATEEFKGHASFHVWAAYSYSPNASWGQIAQEYDEAKALGDHKLKTVVNTIFGETWQEQGDVPDYDRLHSRREEYGIGTVPDGVKFLTCGVDVQKESLIYEIVGWGEGKEFWSIDAGQLLGSTHREEVWKQLEDLIDDNFEGPGGTFKILMTAIDSGYNTQTVYNWCRKYPINRVIAVKGVHTQKTLVGAPSKVDVSYRGKKVGYKVWPVGPGVAKGELYGWLDLKEEDGVFPRGYCHFPEYDLDYFKQLTSEHLVPVQKNDGRIDLQWKVLPNRENHGLDRRVYARAAAAVVGIDRMPDRPRVVVADKAKREFVTETAAAAAPRKRRNRGGGGFLGKGGKGRSGGGWL
jgi:phage terminase large subunit GpA-like protein